MTMRKLRDGLAAGIKDGPKTEPPRPAVNRFDLADAVLETRPEPGPTPAAAPGARTAEPGTEKPTTSRAPAAPHTVPAETVVREIVSMPASDVELLTSLRERCLASGHFVSKSAMVRAGLHALARMSNDEIVALADGLEKRRPGRRPSRRVDE